VIGHTVTRRSALTRVAAGRRRVALIAVTVAGATAFATPCAARAALAPPVTIDGPSASIVSLCGVALAADGSGAVAYRKLTGGVPQTYFSLERAGVWGPPAQLDATITGGSSSCALAAADGGRVAAVWIAGGTLYGAVHAAGASGFSAPQAIGQATGTPALGMGISGTAYVAYLAPDSGATDLDVARLDRTSTRFVVLSGALNAAPMTLAGAGGPAITVAADATAVVAWAQLEADGSTHVFVRRASGAGPSPVLDDATAATLDGLVGGSADSPVVGVEYDSSDAWIAFRETFGAFSRVVVTELLGDELRTPAFADSLGLTAGPSSAFTPSLALNGNGEGLLASELAPGNALAVSTLGSSPGGWSAGATVGTPGALAPRPLAAISAAGSGIVAYTPSPGALDAVPFAKGAAGTPVELSDSSLGPVAATDGLGIAADDNGDVAVGFVAGATDELSVAVQPFVTAPGAPRATGTQLWTAVRRPVLRWQPSLDSWAPPAYSVYVDGARVATTTATSYTVAADLPDGRHAWKVVAVDSLGQRAASTTRRLLVNAVPPLVRLTLAGARSAGATLSFTVSATALSGIRSVSVVYGDGQASSALASTHVYATAGTYPVTVTVTDRAGVTSVLRSRLTLA
jgi:hypothetical protein